MSSNPEGAPSAAVLLLGSAPVVGLLLEVGLLAGLLRGGAPPTVLMLGGAPPTGVLPGWEVHLLNRSRGALSQLLRPGLRCSK